MQSISRYIIEKLKINKDSKLTDRPFPKEDEPVMILYTNYPENDKRTFLFGKVAELHKDVEGKIDGRQKELEDKVKEIEDTVKGPKKK